KSAPERNAGNQSDVLPLAAACSDGPHHRDADCRNLRPEVVGSAVRGGTNCRARPVEGGCNVPQRSPSMFSRGVPAGFSDSRRFSLLKVLDDTGVGIGYLPV